MIKTLRVARNEYLRNVMKGSFVLALLSVPLMIGLGVGLAVVITNLENDPLPVGYVDHSGLLSEPQSLPPQDRHVELIPYPNESAAQEAMEKGVIQAYYVISKDYLTSNDVGLYYQAEPGQNATRQFSDFLQYNLVAQKFPEIAERVIGGDNFLRRSVDGKRELPDGGPPFSVILPLVIGFALVMLLLMSSGYMMNAVVEEKENRTMEVLITTLSSIQLMAGKIIGILGIAFTQFLAWTVFAVMLILVAGQGMGIEWFQQIEVDWLSILLVLLLAIPSFITASSLMVAIGSTVTETQEAQWVVSIFMLLFWAPLWMMGLINDNPNAPIAVILSFLPFTSLMTISVRNMFFFVPYWQIGLSVFVQFIFAIIAIWTAGKAFRLGMLQYGQKLNFKEIFRKPITTSQ